MPKLSTSSTPSPCPGDRRDQPTAAPVSRPCPRCLVALVFERRYQSRGLSGVETCHETYVCPACDARFQYTPADGRWRQIGEAT